VYKPSTKAVNVERDYCSACKGRFFVDSEDREELTKNGFLLCYDCIDRSSYCPVCKNVFVSKMVTSRDVDMCKFCAEDNGMSKSSFTSVWMRQRFLVFRKDNFTCRYCGRSPIIDGVSLECDHILPKSKGGKDDIENLITSCKDCNGGKLDVMLTKDQERLFKEREALNGCKDYDKGTKALGCYQVEDFKKMRSALEHSK
jgi:Zn-finger nucleic acid-binding protein